MTITGVKIGVSPDEFLRGLYKEKARWFNFSPSGVSKSDWGKEGDLDPANPWIRLTVWLSRRLTTPTLNTGEHWELTITRDACGEKLQFTCYEAPTLITRWDRTEEGLFWAMWIAKTMNDPGPGFPKMMLELDQAGLHDLSQTLYNSFRRNIHHTLPGGYLRCDKLFK